MGCGAPFLRVPRCSHSVQIVVASTALPSSSAVRSGTKVKIFCRFLRTWSRPVNDRAGWSGVSLSPSVMAARRAAHASGDGRRVSPRPGHAGGQVERHCWIAVYAQCRLGFERGTLSCGGRHPPAGRSISQECPVPTDEPGRSPRRRRRRYGTGLSPWRASRCLLRGCLRRVGVSA